MDRGDGTVTGCCSIQGIKGIAKKEWQGIAADGAGCGDTGGCGNGSVGNGRMERMVCIRMEWCFQGSFKVFFENGAAGVRLEKKEGKMGEGEDGGGDLKDAPAKTKICIERKQDLQ